MVNRIISNVKKEFPQIKIFVWTGYTLDELDKNNKNIKEILSNIDVLIEGKFIKEQRDITLKFRGSKNQRILYRNVDF